ncbi:MAG: hypothetical protein OEY96_02070 [Gammaproteobacteria bacterium]|nr:hypothetical protein [Gammaproteobacteria bacterium]
MAKWVTEELKTLLDKINEVPYTDDRDRRQLTILMNGFAQMNNKAMDRAAARTRAQLSDWNLDDAVKAQDAKGSVELINKDKPKANLANYESTEEKVQLKQVDPQYRL